MARINAIAIFEKTRDQGVAQLVRLKLETIRERADRYRVVPCISEPSWQHVKRQCLAQTEAQSYDGIVSHHGVAGWWREFLEAVTADVELCMPWMHADNDIGQIGVQSIMYGPAHHAEQRPDAA